MEDREGTVTSTSRPQTPAPELREATLLSFWTGLWSLLRRFWHPTLYLFPGGHRHLVAVQGRRKPHPGTRRLSSPPLGTSHPA